MPNDPRRFKGRSQISIGGLGGGGSSGGIGGLLAGDQAANPDFGQGDSEVYQSLVPSYETPNYSQPYESQNWMQRFMGKPDLNQQYHSQELAHAMATQQAKELADYQQQLELKGIPLKASAENDAQNIRDLHLAQQLATYARMRNASNPSVLTPTISPEEYHFRYGNRAPAMGIPMAEEDAIRSEARMPLAAQEETSGQQARIGSNDLSALRSGEDSQISKRTFPYRLGAAGLNAESAQTTARTAAKQAHGVENRLPHLEARLDTMADLGDQFAEDEYMADMAHRVNMAIPKDTSMVNVLSGKSSFRNDPFSNMSIDRPVQVGYHPVGGPIWAPARQAPAAPPSAGPAPAQVPGNFAPPQKAPEPQPMLMPTMTPDAMPRVNNGALPGEHPYSGGAAPGTGPTLWELMHAQSSLGNTLYSTNNPYWQYLDRQGRAPIAEEQQPPKKRSSRVSTIPELRPSLDY